MAEKTRRVLTEAEAAELVRLSSACTARKGEIRGCERNLVYFKEFLDECDANLAQPGLSEKERVQWQGRRAHCAGPQTAEEQSKVRVAQARLTSQGDALRLEKLKWGPSLSEADGKWTVDA